jgi:GTP-binding protein 1
MSGGSGGGRAELTSSAGSALRSENARLAEENEKLRAQLRAHQEASAAKDAKTEDELRRGPQQPPDDAKRFANHWSADHEGAGGMTAEEMIRRGRAEPGMLKNGLSDLLVSPEEVERERHLAGHVVPGVEEADEDRIRGDGKAAAAAASETSNGTNGNAKANSTANGTNGNATANGTAHRPAENLEDVNVDDVATPVTRRISVGGKDVDKLPQEVEEGNVEYKLKLVSPTPERFAQLVSQMKWRLTEGMGEAVYEIGVSDDGMPTGISDDDLAKSLENLSLMAGELDADTTVIRQREGVSGGQYAEVLVRRYVPSTAFEIRIAIVGNVDSGKSTLLGVLTRGQLDNGRGLARMNVFKHKHEIESGRTSSISHEILGFDTKGGVVNTSREVHGGMSTSDVAQSSAKLINFIDLAGHERYLKTTVFGLSGHAPDFAVLMVGANMGVSGMTKEHLGIALALRVPVFVVVTKIDMCPENIMEETMLGIKKILKSPGCRKIPIVIRNEDDVIVCAKRFVSERIAPIFCVSNVTGECLDLLRKFLNLLPVRSDWERLSHERTEFHIDATWSVPGVGTVVSGTCMAGTMSAGGNYLIGPDGVGHFRPVVAKSIHSKRTPVRSIVAGQTGSVNLKKVKRSDLRKGMVMLAVPGPGDPPPFACREFEAEILVLYHSTTISKNYQAVLHCGVAQQTVKLVRLASDCIRTGDKTNVTFRFMYWPEFVAVGSRLIFREGRTKGIGRVTRVVPTAEEVGAPKTVPTSSVPPQMGHGPARRAAVRRGGAGGGTETGKGETG